MKEKKDSWIISNFGKMEINQKSFNKLNQLDRIEYRQKSDIIKKWQNNNWGAYFGKIAILNIIITTLLLLQLVIIIGALRTFEIFSFFRFFIYFFLILTLFGFLVDILFDRIRKKELKELEEQYFKIEVKK